ncbi:hypothetical protein F5Y18DRAFT_440062 [Xylariaceae sp. FL1019]|nr:hypothetical protein F5Y18DRAFT_440062 [Xylariaceae sp. FL1019]
MHHPLWLCVVLFQSASCQPAKFARDPSPQMTSKELLQFHFQPYGLPDMCVQCLKSSPEDSLFDCSIEFTWEDPNADNSACYCTSGWQWDGSTVTDHSKTLDDTGYLACKTTNESESEIFQFKFENMDHPSIFSLLLSHTFVDHTDFPQPQRANLFGQANITLDIEKTTDTSMTYSIPSPQEARIVGITI